MSNTLKNSLLVAISCIISILIIELFLSIGFGLGNPILYHPSSIYGYRLNPNQHVTRINNKTIKTNNLGLRTSKDWDQDKSNKILFLGDSVTYGGSYIDNSELFTSLIDKRLPNYQVGNAACNGYGVINSHNLVVDSQFQPASIYVTLVADSNFERSLAKSYGWFQSPRFAVIELMFHYLERFVHTIKYKTTYSPEYDEKPYTIKRSAQKLKNLDTHLKQQGYQHYIFIIPFKNEITQNRPFNPLVSKLLKQHQLDVFFIKDSPLITKLNKNQIDEIFYDHMHLSKKGHEIYAEIILKELQSKL